MSAYELADADPLSVTADELAIEPASDEALIDVSARMLACISGRVRAVGEEADLAWIGRRVGARLSSDAGSAELARVLASEIIGLPEGLSDREAVALLSDAPAAYASFAASGIGRAPAQMIWIAGSSSGPGFLLAQLAQAAGHAVVEGEPASPELVLDASQPLAISASEARAYVVLAFADALSGLIRPLLAPS